MGADAHSTRCIEAEISYLRSDLESLRVDIERRQLPDELLDRRPTQVRDGRAAPPSLEGEGFALAHWPSETVAQRSAELIEHMSAMEPLKPSPVQLAFWAEHLPLVQKLSGAREVLPLHASGVRHSPGTGREKVMTPAVWAHVDYDEPEAADQLAQALAANRIEPAPFSRYVLYQGWRALTPPPQDFPLALCNGSTVTPADMIPIDYHIPTAEGEITYRSSGARFSPDHEWWCFPDMAIEETILFKGFDSALGDAFKPLHVAFEDRTGRDTVPRVSIESRYFALFD